MGFDWHGKFYWFPKGHKTFQLASVLCFGVNFASIHSFADLNAFINRTKISLNINKSNKFGIYRVSKSYWIALNLWLDIYNILHLSRPNTNRTRKVYLIFVIKNKKCKKSWLFYSNFSSSFLLKKYFFRKEQEKVETSKMKIYDSVFMLLWKTS